MAEGEYKSRKASRKRPDNIRLSEVEGVAGGKDALEAAMGKAKAASSVDFVAGFRKEMERLRKKVQDPNRTFTDSDLAEIKQVKDAIENVIGSEAFKALPEDVQIDAAEKLLGSSDTLEALIQQGEQKLSATQVSQVAAPFATKAPSVATSGGRSASATKASMDVPTGPPAGFGGGGDGDGEELVKLRKVEAPVQPKEGQFLEIIDFDGNVVERKFPEDLLGRPIETSKGSPGSDRTHQYRGEGVGERTRIAKETRPERLLPAVSAGGGTIPSDVIDDPISGRRYVRKTNPDTGDFVDAGRFGSTPPPVGGSYAKESVRAPGPITDERRLLPAGVGPVNPAKEVAEEATGFIGKLKKGTAAARASKLGRFAGKAIPIVGEALAAYEIGKYAYDNTAGLYDEQRAEQAALGLNVIASLENSKVEGQEFLIERMLDRADEQSRALRDVAFMDDIRNGVMLDQIVAGKERVLAQTSYREPPSAGELLAAMSRF